MAEGVPDEFSDLIRESTLVCTPMAAAGRWLGVILSDRGPDAPAAARRRALPAVDARQDRRARRLRPPGDQQAGPGAPAAGADRPRARGARVGDPAPVRHPARVLQPGGAQPRRPRAHRRRAAGRAAATCAARSSARSAAPRAETRHDAAARRSSACAASTATCTSTLRPGSERRRHPARARAARPVGARRGGPQRPQARRAVARSRSASRSRTRTRSCSTSSTTACAARPASTAWACKLAALEALQVGGIVEFGEREPGTWRVRLAVPLDRT